ncbi:MAG: hypothetical protein KBT30_02945, partial [Clostridiales bacterium]|nr:hypothetical protein [Candidatus Apopatousia equi]
INYSVSYNQDGKLKTNYNYCCVDIFNRVYGLSAEENLVYILVNTDSKTKQSFSTKSYQYGNELGEIISDYTINNSDVSELEM